MPRTIFENIVIVRIEKALSIAFCQYTAIRFFEIVFIEAGNGEININGHNVPYKSGDIFIFIPNDKYNFQIETETTVAAVKFLNSFFSDFSLDVDKDQQKDWFKKIETTLYSSNRIGNLVLKSPTEKNILLSLFTVLCNEYNEESLRDTLILKDTLRSILQVISRNINVDIQKTESSKIQDIVNYIHQHIHNSEQLTNKTIASEFNVAENYIGQYFKKQMGVSLKKYILNHKIKLAETRLKYTDFTLSEIALELGFTDSSHLDKTFKSYKGITPSTYRASAK